MLEELDRDLFKLIELCGFTESFYHFFDTKKELLDKKFKHIDSGSHRHVYLYKNKLVVKFDKYQGYNQEERDTYDCLVSKYEWSKYFLLPFKYRIDIGKYNFNVFPKVKVDDVPYKYSTDYIQSRKDIMEYMVCDVFPSNCGYYNDVLVLIDFSCPSTFSIPESEVFRLMQRHSELYQRDTERLQSVFDSQPMSEVAYV